MNILSKFQLSSSSGLGLTVWINESMSDEAVYRTATATPGLLIMRTRNEDQNIISTRAGGKQGVVYLLQEGSGWFMVTVQLWSFFSTTKLAFWKLHQISEVHFNLSPTKTVVWCLLDWTVKMPITLVTEYFSMIIACLSFKCNGKKIRNYYIV